MKLNCPECGVEGDLRMEFVRDLLLKTSGELFEYLKFTEVIYGDEVQVAVCARCLGFGVVMPKGNLVRESAL